MTRRQRTLAQEGHMKAKTKTAHFTRFGVQIQPREADGSGYLHYREGYEGLPRQKWTAAEEWIAAQESRIAAWRKVQS
jgi:hypothetical protein